MKDLSFGSWGRGLKSFSFDYSRKVGSLQSLVYKTNALMG